MQLPLDTRDSSMAHNFHDNKNPFPSTAQSSRYGQFLVRKMFLCVHPSVCPVFGSTTANVVCHVKGKEGRTKSGKQFPPHFFSIREAHDPDWLTKPTALWIRWSSTHARTLCCRGNGIEYTRRSSTPLPAWCSLLSSASSVGRSCSSYLSSLPRLVHAAQEKFRLATMQQRNSRFSSSEDIASLYTFPWRSYFCPRGLSSLFVCVFN